MDKFFVVIFCCAFFLAGWAGANSEELTGEAILERSEEVKRNFYSYINTTETNGSTVQTSSYSKSLPEGILKWTVRTAKSSNSDRSEPSQFINIIDGYDKFYWYYPDINLAIDLSYQIKMIQKNAETAKKRKEGATVNFEPITEIQYDGFDCYDIKTSTVKDGETIAKDHYLIDKKTYLPRLHEGAENEKTFRVEYKDVKPEPEMTDDFFRLPDGVEIKKATNHQEFEVVLKEIDTIRNPLPKVPAYVALSPEEIKKQAKEAADAALAKYWKEQKARGLPSSLDEIKKQTEAMADAELKKLMKERKERGLPVPEQFDDEREPLVVKTFWTLQRSVIIVGNVVFLSLLLYFLLRRKKR